VASRSSWLLQATSRYPSAGRSGNGGPSAAPAAVRGDDRVVPGLIPAAGPAARPGCRRLTVAPARSAPRPLAPNACMTCSTLMLTAGTLLPHLPGNRPNRPLRPRIRRPRGALTPCAGHDPRRAGGAAGGTGHDGTASVTPVRRQPEEAGQRGGPPARPEGPPRVAESPAEPDSARPARRSRRRCGAARTGRPAPPGAGRRRGGESGPTARPLAVTPQSFDIMMDD